MQKRILIGLVALVLAVFAWAEGAAEATLVPYPEGFRAWRHLGSVMNQPTEKNKATAPHGMIHHIYANEKALEGLRTGTYPEGAVFVAEWFVLKQKYAGGFDEGAHNRTDVMVRDARFAATGGWGFDQFAQDSKTVRNIGPAAAPKACFQCHAKMEAHSYVFSALRP